MDNAIHHMVTFQLWQKGIKSNGTMGWIPKPLEIKSDFNSKIPNFNHVLFGKRNPGSGYEIAYNWSKFRITEPRTYSARRISVSYMQYVVMVSELYVYPHGVRNLVFKR